jgi:hypothetical protein
MVKKQIPMTEEEIALVSSYFFTAKGWNLYPEVVLPIFGGRPDHLGVKNEYLTAVFEYKKSLTYTVIEQLTRWHHEMTCAINSTHTNESKKAIPHLLIAVCQHSNNGFKFPALKSEILNQYRLGYYEISKVRGSKEFRFATKDLKDGEMFHENAYPTLWIDEHEYQLYEIIPPKIQHGSRTSAHRLLEHLNEDMKIGQSGTTGRKDAFMTPFKRTINKAKTVLERGGEWHIDTLIKVINAELGGHHYCHDNSAKQGISKFLVELGIGEKVDNRPVYKLKSE